MPDVECINFMILSQGSTICQKPHFYTFFCQIFQNTKNTCSKGNRWKMRPVHRYKIIFRNIVLRCDVRKSILLLVVKLQHFLMHRFRIVFRNKISNFTIGRSQKILFIKQGVIQIKNDIRLIHNFLPILLHHTSTSIIDLPNHLCK